MVTILIKYIENLRKKLLNKYLIIFLAGIGLLMFYRGPDYIKLWTKFPPRQAFGRDFRAYQAGAIAVCTGHADIVYNIEKFTEWRKTQGNETMLVYDYPPLLFIFYSPFVLFSPVQATRINFCMNHIILFISIACLFFLGTENWQPDKKIIFSLMALPMAFLFSPSIDSLYSGQITIILLLLLTLFTILYVKGKQIAAAFILALAISLKLIPAGFIIYFLVRRDYRALIATFLFLFLLLFPVIIYTGSINMYIDYIQLSPKIIFYEYFTNQSLSACINKYFRTTDYGQPLLNSPLTGDIIIWVITAVMFYITLKPAAEKIYNRERISLEISAFILLTLICLPRSWPHYHTFLLLNLFLTYTAIEQELQSKGRYFIIYLLVFFSIGLIDGEVAGSRNDIILRLYMLKNHLVFYLLSLLWVISIFIIHKNNGGQKKLPGV